MKNAKIYGYPLSGEAFAIKFDGKGIAGQKPPVAWAHS